MIEDTLLGLPRSAGKTGPSAILLSDISVFQLLLEVAVRIDLMDDRRQPFFEEKHLSSERLSNYHMHRLRSIGLWSYLPRSKRARR